MQIQVNNQLDLAIITKKKNIIFIIREYLKQQQLITSSDDIWSGGANRIYSGLIFFLNGASEPVSNSSIACFWASEPFLGDVSSNLNI